ncbi:MAG: hypothetical protein ISS23_01320 [Nanoarchaeota archaeon]|nr:hypothetical protein [Nanoarchaeota archaeon]
MLQTRENVAVLVKRIIEKAEAMIRVKDSALIPYYVNKSLYMFEIEPEDKADLKLFNYKTNKIQADFREDKQKQLSVARNSGANYIFVSNFYAPSARLISIFNPFMVISEAECDFLVRNYYKDVPKEVSKAAHNLDIMLFDKEYVEYLKLVGSNTFFRFSDRFLNFVFSLPYKEQDIDANKIILTNLFHRLDYVVNILAREYSHGKYFKEYFDRLPRHCKEKVVDEISSLERNLDHDLFLLKKDFVIGKIDPVDIYRKDAGSFIEYFQKLDLETRKFVIEKIYDEPVNEEVVDWLNENHVNLLREVGFLGGKENGK